MRRSASVSRRNARPCAARPWTSAERTNAFRGKSGPRFSGSADPKSEPPLREGPSLGGRGARSSRSGRTPEAAAFARAAGHAAGAAPRIPAAAFRSEKRSCGRFQGASCASNAEGIGRSWPSPLCVSGPKRARDRDFRPRRRERGKTPGPRHRCFRGGAPPRFPARYRQR